MCTVKLVTELIYLCRKTPRDNFSYYRMLVLQKKGNQWLMTAFSDYTEITSSDCLPISITPYRLSFTNNNKPSNWILSLDQSFFNRTITYYLSVNYGSNCNRRMVHITEFACFGSLLTNLMFKYFRYPVEWDNIYLFL